MFHILYVKKCFSYVYTVGVLPSSMPLLVCIARSASAFVAIIMYIQWDLYIRNRRSNVAACTAVQLR